MPRPRNIWEVLAQTAESVPGAFDKQREGQNKRTLADLEMMLQEGQQANWQASFDQREEINRQNRMRELEQELYDRQQRDMDIEAEDIERRRGQPMEDAKLREQDLRNQKLMKEIEMLGKPKTGGKDVTQDLWTKTYLERLGGKKEIPGTSSMDSGGRFTETEGYSVPFSVQESRAAADSTVMPPNALPLFNSQPTSGAGQDFGGAKTFDEFLLWYHGPLGKMDSRRESLLQKAKAHFGIQ